METSGAPSPLGLRERWLTTGLLGIGLIVFAINASATSLILPKIMTSLRVELFQIHWVLTAFGIARTIVIPALGWLSGWVGPRTLYLACLSIFTIGTLGSAFAWDWASLMVFRALSGIGGGLIQPLTMAIFYQIFPPSQRGMALAFSLVGWSVGPSVGAFMSGYVLEFASWRTTYLVTVPLGVLGVGLAWWFLPPLRRPQRRQLDLFGLLSMAIAVVTLILALSQGNREGWDSQYILTLLTIAGVTTVAFVIVELRHSEPLMELRLFCVVPFTMAVVVLFLTTVTFRGAGPMLQVFMQRTLGFVPLLVAWTMLPVNIVYGTSVMVIGRLSDRVSPQLFVIGGLVIYAGGFLAYSGINELTTVAMMITLLTLRFFGEACIGSPNNLIALRSLSDHQVMMASGVLGLTRSIAGTLGPALSAVFWDQRYRRHIQHYVENTPQDAFGLTTALSGVQHMFTWLGEAATLVPAKAMALLHRRLLAEASTAAWQDYLLFNAALAILCLVPAVLADGRFWKRPLAPVATPQSPTSTAEPGVPAASPSASPSMQ